ncbi:MAG: GldG family protein [Oscillospiraceae bacterium]|jgi:hypothetical protein|nr:GldG family protein [Oscillospiraceae bacterium]
MKIMNVLNINKIKKSGVPILITVIFLAIIILLNIFVGMLTERFFLKVDLTETGIYTLSDRAAEFLSEVDEIVDVIVLSEESAWRANNTFEVISNILRNYSASSGGQLRIQYVDPNLNSFNGPKYNNSLSDLKEAYTDLEDMTRNDIILLSSRRATIVSAIDLFSQTSDGFGRPSITGIRADQELISALIYVLNEEIAHIVFINNHAENPMEYMNLVFERSGYRSSTINLATQDIPEDTTILVSSAPQFDFLNDEIVKLENFLLLGGNVMIFYDVQMQSLPMLESFLKQWGVTIENKLIFDEEFTFVPQLGILGAYVAAGDLPSTVNAERFTTNVMPMGVFLARPLSSDGSMGTFNVLPLIRTFSASSYAKDISGGGVETTVRESGDDSGPFVLAYNVRRMTRDADQVQVFANLIVGAATLFDDTFLSMYGDSFYNNFLITDLANDLNPFGERVFIAPKDITGSQMLVSAGAARIILITMAIMLPLAIITSGVVVWRKRRHK